MNWTRWLKRAALAAALIPVAGYVYERLAARRASKGHLPFGDFVTVNGRRIYAIVQGQEQPAPTVIFLAGAGSLAVTWLSVLAFVREFAPVLAYDRPGLGWSDAIPGARTPHTLAAELHALLEQTNLPRPYILVGHSLGGVHALAFADLYAHDVAGLVLVDSSHPKMHLKPELVNPVEMRTDLGRMRRNARWGWWRARAGLPDGNFATLPKQVRIALRDIGPNGAATIQSEIHGVLNGTDLSHWPDVPTIVLTRTPAPFASSRAWQELQVDFANRFPRSQHRILPNAGHGIPHDDPQAVIDAVRELVEAYRVSI
jgi:pimeloyl-ACP methyl ester carboxylesterase